MDATSRGALAAGALALTATVTVAVVPFLRFVYVSGSTRVAMESSQALIAGLVAYLVFGRFQRSRGRSDLLLVYALGMSGATNVLMVVVRAGAEDQTSLSAFTIWTGQVLATLAAASFVAAAWLPERALPRTFAAGRWVVLAATGTVLGVCALVAPVANDLPFDVTRVVDAGASGRPDLETDPVFLALHALLVALYVLAAAGFARRSDEAGKDPIALALAAGLAIAAVARLNFVLYPSLYTNVVHTGDVLRLAFYLVLLVGAEREIRAYWRDRARAAVLDERRRIARELHDGLMQELSFIRSHATSVAENRSDPAMLGFVADASRRALDESRRAVQALSEVNADALGLVLRRTVDQVTERAGLRVVFDLAPGIQADADTTTNVTRIAREASVNAVRHAAASELHVTLRQRRDGLVLTITDDGRGIVDTLDGRGFGMTTMRERANELGGRLRVGPAREGGTEVRLDLPGVPMPGETEAVPAPPSGIGAQVEQLDERPDAG